MALSISALVAKLQSEGFPTVVKTDEATNARVEILLTDLESRIALKELIEKYLKGRDPDYDRLIEIVQDPTRQVPIRGVLENIRRYNNFQRTHEELKPINDLLYIYG